MNLLYNCLFHLHTIAINYLMFSYNYYCILLNLNIGITISKSLVLSMSVLFILLMQSVKWCTVFGYYLFIISIRYYCYCICSFSNSCSLPPKVCIDPYSCKDFNIVVLNLMFFVL